MFYYNVIIFHKFNFIEKQQYTFYNPFKKLCLALLKRGPSKYYVFNIN